VRRPVNVARHIADRRGWRLYLFQAFAAADTTANQLATFPSTPTSRLPTCPSKQASKFELVINLETAKAIGLTISESFLLRADKDE
jgi:hypothetical protein